MQMLLLVPTYSSPTNISREIRKTRNFTGAKLFGHRPQLQLPRNEIDFPSIKPARIACKSVASPPKFMCISRNPYEGGARDYVQPKHKRASFLSHLLPKCLYLGGRS